MFEDFFLSLTELRTFCEVKCLNADSVAGKSVHNSRIERLWRDVYYAVIQTFYYLFYHLESLNLLDVESELDLFCLHYVFIPRINKALVEFPPAGRG